MQRLKERGLYQAATGSPGAAHRAIGRLHRIRSYGYVFTILVTKTMFNVVCIVINQSITVKRQSGSNADIVKIFTDRNRPMTGSTVKGELAYAEREQLSKIKDAGVA